MKTKVLCIIAGAALALTLPTAAAAEEAPQKAVAEAEPAKTLAAKDTPAAAPATSQQNRMKHCNEEAKKKELKGDERRSFMSTCLKR
ncbi:MAG TPA: PsiF family protein [Opitutaceae bacterium]|nr:PsiF family protein [Opitutaceae bacterium]